MACLLLAIDFHYSIHRRTVYSDASQATSKLVACVSIILWASVVFGESSSRFRIKILLFALVALHALVFRRSVYNQAADLDRLTQPKMAASLSLLLWLCIVCAGRDIGYQPRSISPHFARVTHASISIFLSSLGVTDPMLWTPMDFDEMIHEAKASAAYKYREGIPVVE